MAYCTDLAPIQNLGIWKHTTNHDKQVDMLNNPNLAENGGPCNPFFVFASEEILRLEAEN